MNEQERKNSCPACAAEAQRTAAQTAADGECGPESLTDASADGCGTAGASDVPADQSCCRRHKKRSAEDKKALVTRLKKIEGQVRGLEKMVEDDAYCPDILIQSSAVTSAMNSFNRLLLSCHIRSCVVEDIRDGKDETIDELVSLLQKLMK